MTKPFHPGRSAESGVVARNSRSSRGRDADRGWKRARILQAAGAATIPRRSMASSPTRGVQLSPRVFPSHPSGSLTHPGMGLMLDLIRKHDIRPEQVVKVKVGTNRHMPNALIHHQPANELQAKFSMEFCMAILLLQRKAGLAEFTDKVVNRPDVKKMIAKVEFGVHPERRPPVREDDHHIDIELRAAENRRPPESARQPANPYRDELAGNFRECAAWVSCRKPMPTRWGHCIHLERLRVSGVDALRREMMNAECGMMPRKP